MSTSEWPEAPQPVGRKEILSAASRVAGFVRRTPVVEVADIAGVGPLWLKLEMVQVTGTFKARGAFNLLRSVNLPVAGVVAASGGNFGLAIAHAAQVLGVPATIFVPESTPAAKSDLLRALGACVEVTGTFYADAFEASRQASSASGAVLAHAYDHPAVVAGAGTCALELSEQQPELDTVLVAVGGGGLIGGVAGWYRGDVKLVAVETAGTSCLHAALAAGRPVDVEVYGVAASSLGARRIGALGLEAARRWVSESLLVDDDAVVAAQRALWSACRVACEAGSAAPLAALMTGAYRPAPGERTGLIICGANLNPAELVPAG